MSIWILNCHNESGDRWIAGYFPRELTEEEQHGYFSEHHDYEYACDDDCEEDEKPSCYIYWELIELKLEEIPKPLSSDEWSEML